MLREDGIWFGEFFEVGMVEREEEELLVDGFAGFCWEGMEFVEEFGMFVDILWVNMSVIDHLLNLNIIGDGFKEDGQENRCQN